MRKGIDGYPAHCGVKMVHEKFPLRGWWWMIWVCPKCGTLRGQRLAYHEGEFVVRDCTSVACTEGEATP